MKRRFVNKRNSDNDIGFSYGEKDRRNNYNMGRDKPYYSKRREDTRFNKYPRRHYDESRSKSSSMCYFKKMPICIIWQRWT